MKNNINWWLIKSEPSVYSISDLEQDKTTLWDGVRNYQARNFLQQMQKGDFIYFYHSSINTPSIVGIATIANTAIPEPCQFIEDSPYFDSKSSIDKPRWYAPKIKFKEKLRKVLTLEELRNNDKLKSMIILNKGNRLSVTPISLSESQELNQLIDSNK
jgi:predicted RNA-binding protein with PUA-like domain